MTIANRTQLENTRAKLKLLEERYAALKQQPTENSYTRELTLRSLQRWISKLKEETLRYDCTAAPP